MAVHEGHRDDLGLVGRKLLHSERLDRSQLAADLNLWELADREIQVADLVGNQQHSLNNGRQIKETHLRSELRRLGFLARDRRQVGPLEENFPSETPQILAHNDDKRKKIMFSAVIGGSEKGFVLLQLCDPGGRGGR